VGGWDLPDIRGQPAAGLISSDLWGRPQNVTIRRRGRIWAAAGAGTPFPSSGTVGEAARPRRARAREPQPPGKVSSSVISHCPDPLRIQSTSIRPFASNTWPSGVRTFWE
jgi:hypothetical protein